MSRLVESLECRGCAPIVVKRHKTTPESRRTPSVLTNIIRLKGEAKKTTCHGWCSVKCIGEAILVS